MANKVEGRIQPAAGCSWPQLRFKDIRIYWNGDLQAGCSIVLASGNRKTFGQPVCKSRFLWLSSRGSQLKGSVVSHYTDSNNAIFMLFKVGSFVKDRMWILFLDCMMRRCFSPPFEVDDLWKVHWKVVQMTGRCSKLILNGEYLPCTTSRQPGWDSN